jgi:hypothetical protein
MSRIRAFNPALAGSPAKRVVRARKSSSTQAWLPELKRSKAINAPNPSEEAQLTQQNRRITHQVHVRERAGQRQFSRNIPTFPVGGPIEAKLHWRPVEVESLTAFVPNAWLLAAITSPMLLIVSIFRLSSSMVVALFRCLRFGD